MTSVADIISALQGKPQRIVVIDWSMIGDLIMLSPCIDALHKAYPAAHLAILGTPASIAGTWHSSAARLRVCTTAGRHLRNSR